MADERTLLIETNREKFKVTIPADWKVTFGKQLGVARDYDGGRELRIYEGESKQRACFTGVQSFRDLSIPLTRIITSENGTEEWEDNGLDSYSHKSTRKRSTREVPA
jgi:hypothetical protein